MNRSVSNRTQDKSGPSNSARFALEVAMNGRPAPVPVCRRIPAQRSFAGNAAGAARKRGPDVRPVRKSSPDARATQTPIRRRLDHFCVNNASPYILNSRCACEMMDKILTHCNIICKPFKFYVKERFLEVSCQAGVVKDVTAQGGGMEGRLVLGVWHALLVACVLWPFSALADNSYVGTAACKDCHEEQHENFTKYAKKAHSDRSIKVMASDLTDDELEGCYGCHATGYGQPGGFVSYEKTPHLADAGCEVCHGPGYEHVESGGDSELIKGKLTMDDCVGCHNEERVKAFNFKPLLYGGAH